MRSVVQLHENWKFHLGDVPEAFYRGYDDAKWETVCVPHDWSVGCEFSQENSSGTGYLPGGIGWYRTHFQMPEQLTDKRITVTFEGVYNNSQVWCNTHNLGKRPYGYSSFCYEITEFVQPGDNVLSIAVRHEHTADSRWFTGSGIYRPVRIEITSDACFQRHGIFTFTQNADATAATIGVQWAAEAPKAAEVRFSLFDTEAKLVAQTERQGATGNCTLGLKQPKLWSPDTPYLYCLRAELVVQGAVTDCIETPVGIRSFYFDADNGFFLNGTNQKLKGVCLHHDAGVLGAAVPMIVWKRRLEKLKELGCNAIRTSHNPPDPALLELCDTMGFLVMDEAFDEWEGCKNKWWQGHNVYPPKHFGYSEDFPNWHKADLTEMVCRDRNHPCVILWSIGNEIDYPNDPYCSPFFETMTGNNDANKPAQERVYDPNKPDAKRLGSMAKQLCGIVKQFDTTRPVTAAIAFPELSNQVGYTHALDIVGYNYKEHLYEQDHVNYPQRVLYGSENGHTVQKWSFVRDNPYICGQFLWTGIDYMGEAKGWPVRVATPGLLTMAGFEKPRYYHRKAMWSEELFAVLATKLVTESTEQNNEPQEIFGWNYKSGAMVEVCCYSNAQQVELFLNDYSLGIQTADVKQQGEFCWSVQFQPGVLRAEAKGQTTVKVAQLQTAGEPIAVQLSVYPVSVNEQIQQVEAYLIDKDGILVTQNDQKITWCVTNAVLLGTESGAPDDLVSYTSNTRKTFHGQMIGYLRKIKKDLPVQVVVKLKDYVETLNI